MQLFWLFLVLSVLAYYGVTFPLIMSIAIVAFFILIIGAAWLRKAISTVLQKLQQEERHPETKNY